MADARAISRWCRCVCLLWATALSVVSSHAQFGFTALIGAAGGGHSDCVRLLLDAGADKNATDEVRAGAGGGVWGVARGRWWKWICG